MMAGQPKGEKWSFMQLLGLLLGWIHLLFATVVAIGLAIYLLVYYSNNHDDEDEVSPTGLPSVIFLFVFCVASMIFDVLLIRGISEKRMSLIALYVYVNFIAMAIIICLSIVNFVRDITNGVPAGRFLLHRILHLLILFTMAYLVYPIQMLYKQMLRIRNQPEQPEERRLSNNAPIEETTKVTRDHYIPVP